MDEDIRDPLNVELDLLRDFYSKWRHYHDLLHAPTDVRKQAGEELITAHHALEAFTKPVVIHG